MTRAEVPTQQNVCNMRVSCKRDPIPFPPSVRDGEGGGGGGGTWRAPPPHTHTHTHSHSYFLTKGLSLIQARCWMFNSPLFLMCGADLDEKVTSGKSRTLWRGFIRYDNLSFLQGKGQRWLLFAPYFMARKIIDPCRVHLVHMEVTCLGMGFCSTQCSTSAKQEAKRKQWGKKCFVESNFDFSIVTIWSQSLISLSLVSSGLQHVTLSWVSSPRLSVSLLFPYSLAERENGSITSPSVLMVCSVSFTGGNQIQWTDCGTNDPGQSSCTGVRFQPLNDDVTPPMWQGSVSLWDQLFTAFNWISWIQIAPGIHFL